MDSFLWGAASALWLGILTSISPCPLATNIAAVSYISNNVTHPRFAFWAGLLYVVGRMITYLILGAIMVASLLSIPDLSQLLQKHFNIMLGPLLVIAGVFLLGIIRLNVNGFAMSGGTQKRLESYGIWGAGLFGILFALSFCPVTAALFFGSLVPLSVSHHSSFIYPAVYGIGTGLPVMVIAILIAMGAKYIGEFFNRVKRFELWARRLTGGIFILVGIYFILVYIVGLDLGF